MAKDEEQILSQPTEDEQREYLSAMNNDATEVSIVGSDKKYKVHWLKNSQIEKLSRLMLKKGKTDKKVDDDVLSEVVTDSKLACKTSAIYTLNRGWKLFFLYWFRWRWFYYVREYSFIQLRDIIMEGKKKIPQMQYYAVTTLLIGAKATLMTMRAKEVEAFLHAQDTEQRSQQQKSGNG